MNDFSPSDVPPAPDPLADDTQKILAEMNAKYAVVSIGGRTRIGCPGHYDPTLERKHLLVMPVADFRAALSNRIVWVPNGPNKPPVPVPLASWWLAHPDRRQYLDGVVCDPEHRHGPTFLNLWQGFTTEPCAGDPSVILEHIAFLASGPDEAAALYLLNWIARTLQLPGRTAEVAVVLRGKKGSGKGALGNLLCRLFGVHGFYAAHQRDLASNFNSHLMNACFVFADECFFAGDRQHESTLKSLITEPHLRVEFKGVDVFQARNRVSLFMSSNKQWVVPATADERRFFVLDVPDTHIGHQPYWKKLFAALNNKRTRGAFLKYMLERDLTDFDHRVVPQTAALDHQKAASFTIEERWLSDLLHRGVGIESFTNSLPSATPWQQEIPFDSLVSSYLHYCAARGDARYALDRSRLGKFLSQYFTKTRPWATVGPRPWCYDFGPLEDARQRFCEIQNLTVEWDDE